MPIRGRIKQRSIGAGGGSTGSSMNLLHAQRRVTGDRSRDFVADALTGSPLATALSALDASMANVGLVVALVPGARLRRG